MNPDVVSATGRLRSGLLSDGLAALFDRVARRRLVSLSFELRALLYVGVLLLTAGVGVLVAAHHHEIGRLTIAGGIGLAARGSEAPPGHAPHNRSRATYNVRAMADAVSGPAAIRPRWAGCGQDASVIDGSDDW